MNTLRLTVSDSVTMLGRNLLHMIRYPVVLYSIAMPVIFLLLFVYVFGGTLGAGLAGGTEPASYLEYVVPGVLLLAAVGAATGSAISVAQDMTEGIIARFRTMDISRSAVLTGHLLGNVVQGVITLVVVIGVALAMGFRSAASPLDWLAAVGVLVLILFAVTSLGVALGMAAKGVEGASNLPMPLMLLPFLGSGFVPTESMPPWLQWFAESQPFTPYIETLRAFLLGTPIGNHGWLTIAWCAAMLAGSHVWARFLYERRSVTA